ncbi:T9SS type A sorting domain-containing protein [Flavobacterium jejuense]|uniref:T9SS type A sorting domain-containing protein n=1 Tax=Flavobacterium jejuense TaxID=1544455 RepID=A0ABX0IUG2_9FLAO|nr:zinc-dependent metalloprotease [Flavobacterium jejuense]NHN27353.1 T9SS type A sorting domain-containing protein [Flavobacterium jejuense]
MKRILLIFAFYLFASNTSMCQTNGVWSKVKNENFKKNKAVERQSFPMSYKLMQLNIDALRQTLSNAPDRFSKNSNGVVISLPNSEGVLEQFEMFEASNFEPSLQAQFPEIRSYAGNGIEDKHATLRMSIDPKGIQTMVFRADKETEFMEPYSEDGKIYAVYKSSRVKGKLPFTCSTSDQNLTKDLSSNDLYSRSSAGTLLTFRLALSCTAEYANYFGATSAANVGLVNAAYNATMTRVNGVFEKDFAIHMNIIGNNNNVIYYDASSDPYSPASQGQNSHPVYNYNKNWNIELQNTLTSVIGNSNYDVGHLFGATGGGGNAGCIGCVCEATTTGTYNIQGQLYNYQQGKGSGYTSPSDGIPSGDNFDIDFVAHEMGHQFGANHTFSHSNEGSGVNVEPGSGSTIMGYAGITPQDVQQHSDDYFHAASIAQVQVNMTGKTCPTSTSITHGAPIVTTGGNVIIPKSTPFMLIGSATDNGGTASLTYCWEQMDNASAAQQDANSAASITKASGPNFRSYPPSVSPTRYFPRLSSVFSGSATTSGSAINVEALSSVARTLNFRLTARDNVAGQGQTGFGNKAVIVDATRGPLTVTSQSTAGIAYPLGSIQTVTWAVNNTDASAGGANVDILLTSDGGATWSTLLANTANDGSETVTMPSNNLQYCRLMVKASNSIFFNVNSKDFAVGDYTYQTQNVCQDYPFNLNTSITESTGGYPGYNLPISDSFTITDINFYADITHANIGQVNILLAQPWEDISGGLSTALWYNTGCVAADLDKWFDTSGVSVVCSQTTSGSDFKPYSSANVNAGIGQNSAGNWGVYFKDGVVDGVVGTFNTFTIQLCHAELVPVLSSDSFNIIDDLVLYPNPNNGSFNIRFTSNTASKIKVVVNDIRGRQVFNKNYENSGLFDQNLQLNNVQSGIYLVTVEDGLRKEVKKIIVE